MIAAPLALSWLAPSPGTAANNPQSRRELARGVDLAMARYGVDIGAWVFLEGHGVLYERKPDRPMPAASAIKSFVALDLLLQRGPRLNRAFPEPLAALGHEAFQGFTPQGLDQARKQLCDKTYRELAEIMMGRGGYPVEVYNAACNMLLVDLGGPKAVNRRMLQLSPDFDGIDLNRFMEQWHSNGDNMITPRALGTLYFLLSRNEIPGASAETHDLLRGLLARHPESPPTEYEKSGTLYPAPLARVRAGYLDREGNDLVYALMGTMRSPGHLELPDAFVLLLASMDTLTTAVKEVF